MVASFGLPPWPLVLPTAPTGVVGLGIGRASSNPTAAATALHLSGLIAPAPQSQHQHPLSHASSSYASDYKFCAFGLLRREALFSSLGLLSGALSIASTDNTIIAMASEFADMPALRGKDYGKTKMRYPDYTETESGLQYKDLQVGNGSTPKMGDTVVVDWDGYTIGYYGRIFEARNKSKGGSFVGDDKDFFKFKLGSGEVIPAFEEAVSGMAPGGIRSGAGSLCPQNWDTLRMTSTRVDQDQQHFLVNEPWILC